MPFKKRTPPIKVEIKKEEFNKLIEIINNTNENVSQNSEKLKDKLLKYSIPTDNDSVIIRLFPYEAEAMIGILFSFSNVIDIKDNYYETLLSNRKIREERGDE